MGNQETLVQIKAIEEIKTLHSKVKQYMGSENYHFVQPLGFFKIKKDYESFKVGDIYFHYTGERHPGADALHEHAEHNCLPIDDVYSFTKSEDNVEYVALDPSIEMNKNIEDIYTTLSQGTLNNKGLSNVSKAEISNLTYEQLTSKFYEEMDEINFDDVSERIEFYNFLGKFNTRKYSFRNKLLLRAQTSNLKVLDVCASYKEWIKEGCNVKKGAKALMIIVPTFKKSYYERDVDGSLIKAPYPNTPEDLKLFNAAIRRGDMIMKEDIKEFIPVNSIFSIDHTNMDEAQRVSYLQRFEPSVINDENTYEVYTKVVKIANELGCTVVESDILNAALGWVNTSNGEITIKQGMPDVAKIATLTHEIGHWILHADSTIPKPSHAEREIQAEVFSGIVLESIGIDSNKYHNLKYIDSYLDNEYRKPTKEEVKELGTNELIKTKDKRTVLYESIEKAAAPANKFLNYFEEQSAENLQSLKGTLQRVKTQGNPALSIDNVKVEAPVKAGTKNGMVM